MIGDRGKNQGYIAAVLLLIVFCVSFLHPAQVKAAVKKPMIRVNIKFDKEYTKGKKLKLSIKNKQKGYVIRYTTNGKRPRYRSKKYRKPIIVEETTVIKAQIFKGRKKVSSVKKIKIRIKKVFLFSR